MTIYFFSGVIQEVQRGKGGKGCGVVKVRVAGVACVCVADARRFFLLSFRCVKRKKKRLSSSEAGRGRVGTGVWWGQGRGGGRCGVWGQQV